MKIYNSMTRKKEEFIPIDGNNVKMYACGITVYDLSHIGHARQAIVYAMIANYLRYRGYHVKYVRNYTDVDDKIIHRANSLGIDALEFSKEQIRETEIDMANLHVTDADIYAKASENMENIISFIEGLIQKNHAYIAESGDVYFDVRSFPTYGKLSNRNIDELINGVRKEVEQGKKDPIDFALWKSSKPGEISWESPWGKGRPGWHIECSAMILNHLGETIDIHGGGKDLIFPHHENEIAQSEALTGKEFVKYWSHCGLIKINGEKMSKSLGNSLTIREALEKYNYEVIKYVILSKHYTSDIDLLDSDFELAEKHMYYFYSTISAMEDYIQNFQKEGNISVREDDMTEKIISDFEEVMDDDFNTVVAISNLYGIFKYVNGIMKTAKKADKISTANTISNIQKAIREVYGVLGMLKQNPKEFIKEMKKKYSKKLNIDEDLIENKIRERLVAKKEKNFTLADEIRLELEEKGILLMDTVEGTKWDFKALYNAQNETNQ